jgi:hypothetical protein
LEFGAAAVNNFEVTGKPEQLTNTRSDVRYINVKIRDLSTVHGITITEQLTNAHPGIRYKNSKYVTHQQYLE